MTRSKLLLPLTLAVTALVPTSAALASIPNPTADAALRKGIRDVVRLEAKGGTAKHIDVTCKPVKKVGQKGACTGTFQVAYKGRTATYKLTPKARTLRISRGAIEYRVAAKAVTKVAGLPASTDLAGFLQ
jgi:hypothetical protein